MKRAIQAVVIAFALTQVPAVSQAKMIEIWASGLGGGAWGNGKGDVDFFSWAGGPTVGLEGGVSFLFLSVYADYTYFFGGDASGYLIGVNLGGDNEFSLTDNLALVLRLAATAYLGDLEDNKTRTGTSITSNNVDTDGFGFRGGLGLRYSFLKVLSVGVTPQVGYHFFFTGAPLGVPDNDSQGWDVKVMGYLRVGLGV